MRLEVRYIDEKGRERMRLYPKNALACSTPEGLEISTRSKTTLYRRPIRHRWRHEECKHLGELIQMDKYQFCLTCGLRVD